MKRASMIAGITFALLILASTPASPLGLFLRQAGMRPAFGTRQGLELLVMGLQVVGVLVLGWMKLVPASAHATWALMGVQVGLGMSGAFCAGFESGFALYAGATLMLLLLGAMVRTEDSSHAARARSAALNG